MSRPEAASIPAEAARSRAVERALVRVRWFGVAFGLFQVWQLSATTPSAPGYLVPGSYVSVAALAIGNLLISRSISRTGSPSTRARIGLAAFSLDIAVVFANIWLASYDRYATTWTLAYVLPLEGAIRYQFRGAVASIGIFFASELPRELYRMTLLPDLDFQVASVTFRVGIFAIVALVAGMMARSLRREQVEAESRAAQLARMAARDRAARAEIQAQQDVVMAGLAGGTFDDVVRAIADAMQRAFGYEAFAIGLTDESTGGVKMVVGHGFPEGSVGRTLPAGTGVVGRAIASGRPQIVADTSVDPDYAAWIDSVRSEMVVPIRVGDRIIGVVDVESAHAGRFTQEDVVLLERLGSQIGLVISNARLLAIERAAVERLQELDTMKTDFVAVTSHELRTPLTSIQGFVKTMRRPDVPLTPEQTEEFLAIIDRQTERLARIVDGLLTTARIDAGRVDLQMDPVDVASLLTETLHELRPASARVLLSVEQPFPRIVTDGQRLGQIARNLIENALKFSPEDRPVVVTAVREGSWLLLEVADRGAGLSPIDLEHVFDRFHQVGGSLRRRGEGLGLGLYIVRNLVEALNGNVDARSVPGEGSTFSVTIPLVPAGRAFSAGA